MKITEYIGKNVRNATKVMKLIRMNQGISIYKRNYELYRIHKNLISVEDLQKEDMAVVYTKN